MRRQNNSYFNFCYNVFNNLVQLSNSFTEGLKKGVKLCNSIPWKKLFILALVLSSGRSAEAMPSFNWAKQLKGVKVYGKNMGKKVIEDFATDGLKDFCNELFFNQEKPTIYNTVYIDGTAYRLPPLDQEAARKEQEEYGEWADNEMYKKFIEYGEDIDLYAIKNNPAIFGNGNNKMDNTERTIEELYNQYNALMEKSERNMKK